MKKLFVFAAMLALLFSMLATPAFAAEQWDGVSTSTAWYDADPSAAEFVLSTAADLAGFASLVDGGNSFSGKTVKLAVDIDLAGNEWNPIGDGNNKFKGTFDGQNHTVSNLVITTGLTNAAANNCIGFFARTESPAVVKNFTIENVDITGSLYVGAVVGYAYTGKEISGVTVKGDIAIDAYWYAGVIGGNGYLSTVNNCHVIGNDGSYITGNNGSYIGGIWGFRGEGDQKITDCSVTNLVVTGVDRVGGISGMAHYGNSITGCSTADVKVYATDADATTVGTIAGANQGKTSEPSTVLNNNSVGTEAFAGDVPVERISGTNISGTEPVTNSGNGTLNAANEIVEGFFDSMPVLPIASGSTAVELPDGRVYIHVHEVSTAATQAKPASCTEPGNVEYYSCAKCVEYGVYYNTAGEVILPEDCVIPATDHAWGAWQESSAPTCTAMGTEKRVCANDEKHVETRETTIASHVDYNGDLLCDVCRFAYPGYAGRENPSTGVKLP